MVTEIETGDDVRFQCEECGRTFGDQVEAETHVDDCFVPPSMLRDCVVSALNPSPKHEVTSADAASDSVRNFITFRKLW